MSAKNKQLEIVLVAVAGADVEPGAEHAVPTDEPLPIGRASRGLTLPDPLVSIQHAKITFDARRGYVIEDLGSATGTWVDEECIKSDSRPIGVGTRLRFGDSMFEVAPTNRLPERMKWVGGGAMGMVVLAFLVFVLAAAISDDAPPEISVRDKQVQSGKFRLDMLRVPVQFLRERGLHVTQIGVLSVEDYNYDGYDEVMLDLDNGRTAMLTFAHDSTPDDPKWIVLGEFPTGCDIQKGDLDQYPPLNCQGTMWVMEDDRGYYTLVQMDGVVVYYRECDASQRPSEAKEAPAPRSADEPLPVIDLGIEQVAAVDLDPDLSVGRFVMKNEEAMAAFLVDRGVTGPVHYVICEDAFPGVAAQALRSDGTIQKMATGCIHELRLEGTECGDPVAFALSAPGHQALIDDVRTFYAGNPDGLFLPASRRPVVEPLEEPPGFLRGGVKLVGETGDVTAGGFNPVPDHHRPLDQGARVLIHQDPRILPAPKALTVNIPDTGKHRIPTGLGCLELEVDASEFYSRGWKRFLPWRGFLTVDDVGCDPGERLLSAGYPALSVGVYDAQVQGVDVRVVIEGHTWGRGTDVLRTRVTWRQAPPPNR